ncbi:hypothetical protein IFT43_06735 [Oxalobacteraceae sp. CFBP 13708]|nr:hypothetical protein [Oxalobacteraceae sp. CFBP 13708]
MIDTETPICCERVEEHIMMGPPRVARKGRGAVSNLQGHYEGDGPECFDNRWFDEGDEPAVFKTVVTDEFAKSILLRNVLRSKNERRSLLHRVAVQARGARRTSGLVSHDSTYPL